MQIKYIAEVMNNNDADQAGKVQVYIPHLMEGMNPTHYPWAKQDKEWTSFIPEIGEYIWVWFDDKDFLKQAYYGNKVTLKEYHDHASSIGSMTGIYPNIKYIKLNNGVAIALNSLETEASIIVGSAEIYINPSGVITIKGSQIIASDLTGAISFNILTHTHPTAGTGAPSPPTPGS